MIWSGLIPSEQRILVLALTHDDVERLSRNFLLGIGPEGVGIVVGAFPDDDACRAFIARQTSEQAP